MCIYRDVSKTGSTVFKSVGCTWFQEFPTSYTVHFFSRQGLKCKFRVWLKHGYDFLFDNRVHYGIWVNGKFLILFLN